MKNPFQKQVRNNTFSDNDFERLSIFIYNNFGIRIPKSKKTMLPEWLNNRIETLGIPSFKDYIDRVLDPNIRDDELTHFIDVVTTNKTGFFHEPEHFEYLARKVLPKLVQNNGAGVGRPLMLWSAGCSSGEEPYTLTMVLKEFSEHIPGINFKAKILATDISNKALRKAQNAVYKMQKVEELPLQIKKKYLLKSKDSRKNIVRIDPDLRSMVSFRQLNLMDEKFGLREAFDVIFCRNVIHYFDNSTKEQIINKFYNHINPGGFLFIGNSETLDNINTPFQKITPTIYHMPEKT
ncbi:MAG: methyltransferase [Magnetococcales bacterium]|nr:methyltransferase [Magnetococcales bacterium]